MSRRRASEFLHLEAESGSEEYESEEESEDLDNLVPIAQPKSKSFTELTRELEDRYKGISQEMEEEEDQEDVLEIPSQSQLLPTTRSPLLFLIRCKVGKERDICRRIFERVKSKEICSVIQKEGLKGYIYVESFKKQSVEDILSTVRFVARRKLSIVPFREMVEAISYKKNIIISEFARIKSGKYRGDLVKVLENYEDVVKIKAIPRLNDVKRRFDPEEHRSETVKKDGGYYYNRDFYRDGYLEKIMLKSNLDFEVEPTFVELNEMSITGSFDINDTIKVLKGDLRNLVGRIENLRGNAVFISRNNKTYELNINDIEKHFEVGQEVSYRGENGVVLNIEDKKAILGMDDFAREVECFMNDIKPPVPEKRVASEKPIKFRIRRDPLINRSVLIRKGEYKGLQGVVKDSHQDKLIVQLRSNFKIVTLDRGAISSDIQPTEVREGMDFEDAASGKTPSFKTPTFKTPAFKTPTYRTPSFKTPSSRGVFSNPGSYIAEEAGTNWPVSIYDGVEVQSNGKIHTLSDIDDGMFKTRTGETFFAHEIQYCEPEKYERIVIMEGENKGTEGILISTDHNEGIVKCKDGQSHRVEISKITKKVE